MEDCLNVNFTKLDKLETISRLSSLVRNRNQIKIWFQKRVITDYFGVDVVNTDEVITLFITSDVLEANDWDNEEILINFCIGSVDYVCECKAVEIESGGELKIDINSAYRAEKRDSERLLTFPHRKVYVYMNTERERKNDRKVVFLNRTPPKEANILKEYMQEFSKYDELLGQLTGFRVLDISKNGVSFMANAVEKNFFLELEKISQMIVEFNNETFRLHEGEIKYYVDYIDPRSISVPMFKIGLYVEKPDDELVLLIERILSDEKKVIEEKKEFEEFLRCI